MKNYLKILVLILFSCFLYNKGVCQDGNLRVVIIRHGEKPENGNNLSCQGFNRSLQLVKVLNAKFGVPSAIFVPSVGSGKKTKTARMFQTITPFAVKYNLPVNSNYDEEDYKDIARDVTARTGTVIMVWEHNTIPALAQALGVKKEMNWKGSDFDSIWVINFKNGKAKVTLDSEGITPEAGCAF